MMLTLHKLGPAQIFCPILTTITEKTISVHISVNIRDNSTNKVSRPYTSSIYQVAIWKRSNELHPPIPPPVDDHGWMKGEDGMMEPL